MLKDRIQVIPLWVFCWMSVGAQSAFAHDSRVHVHAPPTESRRLVVVETPPALPPTPQVQVVEVQSAPAVEVVQTTTTVRAPLREERPSVLKYSLQGFFAGSLTGLAIGHLAIHDRSRDPGRSYLLASGIGALSGAGLGVALGLFDTLHDARPARYVLRDAGYGTLLGGLFGVTAGGLVMISSGRGEDPLLGAAIGATSGFVLGALVGVLEGHRRPFGHLSVGWGAPQDLTGSRAFGPSLSGRF